MISAGDGKCMIKYKVLSLFFLTLQKCLKTENKKQLNIRIHFRAYNKQSKMNGNNSTKARKGEMEFTPVSFLHFMWMV